MAMPNALIRSVKDQKGAVAGLVFIVSGAAAFIIARDYHFGSVRAMGPGFFPSVLSVLLMLIGILSVVTSLRVKGEALEGIKLWPVCLVTIAILGFGMMARPFGFAAAIVFCVIVSSLGSSRVRWIPAAFTALFMTVLCSAIFVWGLGMPYQIVPMLGW